MITRVKSFFGRNSKTINTTAKRKFLVIPREKLFFFSHNSKTINITEREGFGDPSCINITAKRRFFEITPEKLFFWA